MNNYRHIIDVYYSRESDVEWILELRGYKKLKNYPKIEGVNSPGFYDIDLDKYKKRNDYGNFKPYLKTNVGVLPHIFSNPAGLPPNDSTVKYSTNLRTYENTKQFKNPELWKSITLPRQANLFQTFLSPTTSLGKSCLNLLGESVSRPIQQITTVIIYI